jgi:hypothetical protein
LGEKCLARLTLGRTHSHSPTARITTHPPQYGHVYPTTRPRAFRCIITCACTTLTPHSDPAILRTCPPIPLPPISRRIQHDHYVTCDGFYRHTRLWRGRACYISDRCATRCPVIYDWRSCEACPHLGRKYVTSSSATQTISSGSNSHWCRSHPLLFRSFARAIVSLSAR